MTKLYRVLRPWLGSGRRNLGPWPAVPNIRAGFTPSFDQQGPDRDASGIRKDAHDLGQFRRLAEGSIDNAPCSRRVLFSTFEMAPRGARPRHPMRKAGRRQDRRKGYQFPTKSIPPSTTQGRHGRHGQRRTTPTGAMVITLADRSTQRQLHRFRRKSSRGWTWSRPSSRATTSSE